MQKIIALMPVKIQKKDFSHKKIIFDKKLTRKERKIEYIKQNKLNNENKKDNLKKLKKNNSNQNLNNSNKTDNKENNIFIVRHGKVSKNTKKLINSLRLIFYPFSNIKFEETNNFEISIYKEIKKTYNLKTFFILKEINKKIFLKIIDFKNKKNLIYKIINFKNYENKKYKNEPLLTFNLKNNLEFKEILGNSKIENVDQIERVLNFSSRNNLIFMRHFEVKKCGDSVVKIGLENKGLQIDFEFFKEIGGGMSDKW